MRTLPPALTPIPTPKMLQPTSAYRGVGVSEHLNDSPLVPLSRFGLEQVSYYHSEAVNNPLYGRNFPEATAEVMLRECLLSSLLKVNESLQTWGLRLICLDGYRSLECQTAIRRFFEKAAAKQIPLENLTAEEQQEAIANYADKFCSRPSESVLMNDPRTWHAHVTGAAIDVSLQTLSGESVEMGGEFDDPSDLSFTDFYERKTEPSATDRQARDNRRILFWEMLKQGWVNYPFEWWHFDSHWGNFRTQFGIHNSNCWNGAPETEQKATFGPATIPTLD